jgi:predicted nucleic acid-binding protein
VRITLDINILLDVFQSRQPHYAASARVVSMVENGAILGICPGHGLTTLYYFVRKLSTKNDAEATIDRMLNHFQVCNLDVAGLREARLLQMDDFEDAVVASVAKASGSDFIVTRNIDDFKHSPVPANSPTDFLIKIAARP